MKAEEQICQLNLIKKERKKERSLHPSEKPSSRERVPAERPPHLSRELFDYRVYRWQGRTALGDFAADSLGRILNDHPLGEAARGRSHVDGLASRGCRGRGRELTAFLSLTLALAPARDAMDSLGKPSQTQTKASRVPQFAVLNPSCLGCIHRIILPPQGL